MLKLVIRYVGVIWFKSTITCYIDYILVDTHASNKSNGMMLFASHSCPISHAACRLCMVYISIPKWSIINLHFHFYFWIAVPNMTKVSVNLDDSFCVYLFYWFLLEKSFFRFPNPPPCRGYAYLSKWIHNMHNTTTCNTDYSIRMQLVACLCTFVQLRHEYIKRILFFTFVSNFIHFS